MGCPVCGGVSLGPRIDNIFIGQFPVPTAIEPVCFACYVWTKKITQ